MHSTSTSYICTENTLPLHKMWNITPHENYSACGNSFPEYLFIILYILDYQSMSMLFLTYSMHQLVSVPHSMHSLSQLDALKPPAQLHMQVTGFRVPPFWHIRLQAGRDTEQRKLRTDPFLLLTSIHVSNSMLDLTKIYKGESSLSRAEHQGMLLIHTGITAFNLVSFKDSTVAVVTVSKMKKSKAAVH